MQMKAQRYLDQTTCHRRRRHHHSPASEMYLYKVWYAPLMASCDTLMPYSCPRYPYTLMNQHLCAAPLPFISKTLDTPC